MGQGGWGLCLPAVYLSDTQQSLQPAQNIFGLAKAMMRDAWDKRFAVAHGEKLALKNQPDDLNRQIESLLDRIVETSNSSVVGAYEYRIYKLERDKIVLREKLDSAVPEMGRFEECMELALRFLTSLWKIYKMVKFLSAKPSFGWRLLSQLDILKMV